MSTRQKYALALAVVCVIAIGYSLGNYSTLHTSRTPPRVATAVETRNVTQSAQSDTQTKKIAAPKLSAPRVQRSEELPSGPFGSNVEILKRLADKNADAAYMLAQGFQDCQFFVAPKDDSAAVAQAETSTVNQLSVRDEIVDQVKEAAKKNGIKLGAIPEPPVQSIYEENLSALQKQTRECAGVDTHAARDWMTWQRQAAELGNPEAELKFWQSLRQDADGRSLEELIQDKRVAETALQDALARGEARALIAIGVASDIGLFSDPDPESAYAYFFAASQAPNADIRTLPWIGQNFFQILATGSDTHQYVQRNLDRIGANLSPSQQQAAQQLGLNLYRQCCQGGGL